MISLRIWIIGSSGPKGNGKKARAALVRACMSHHGAGFGAEKWKEVSRICRRMMGLALERKQGNAGGKMVAGTGDENDSGGLKSALHFAGMTRHRLRYFTDDAVIGSKAFVALRERFTEKRRDGARRMPGQRQGRGGRNLEPAGSEKRRDLTVAVVRLRSAARKAC